MRWCQCTLERKLDNGIERTVSYIPESYAVQNKMLKLKINDEWTSGWKVMLVSEPTDCPPDYRKGIRNHRKKTGDSLPK